jgi:hypothetical protein
MMNGAVNERKVCSISSGSENSARWQRAEPLSNLGVLEKTAKII